MYDSLPIDASARDDLPVIAQWLRSLPLMGHLLCSPYGVSELLYDPLETMGRLDRTDLSHRYSDWGDYTGQQKLIVGSRKF